MARSIDQQIAEAQSRLNKLKDRGRYILASLSLAAARNDPAPAGQLLRGGLNNDRDRASCAGIMADLEASQRQQG